MSGKYDDIINLPHHVSHTHKQMTAENRAAQFAPFAVLTGYGEAISQTTRINADEHDDIRNHREDDFSYMI